MNADRLRDLLHYDPETGIFTNRSSRGRAKSGAVSGCLNGLGYVRICLDGIDYSGHRLAWLYTHGEMPKDQIDHINTDRSDNRIANLRLATNSQNNQNRPLQRNNTSGVKGVGLHKQSGLWYAYAHLEGKRFSAGYHRTIELAEAASNALRERIHREFANHGQRKFEIVPE